MTTATGVAAEGSAQGGVLGWPSTGLWVVGLFIATDLIVYGLTMIGTGWRHR